MWPANRQQHNISVTIMTGIENMDNSLDAMQSIPRLWRITLQPINTRREAEATQVSSSSSLII